MENDSNNPNEENFWREDLDDLLGLMEEPGPAARGRDSTAYFSAADFSMSSTEGSEDRTLGSPSNFVQFTNLKLSDKKTEQSAQDLEKELESLKSKMARVTDELAKKKGGEKLQLVPLDLTQPQNNDVSKESLVHKGDSSSSEDEAQERRQLSSEGKQVKHRLAEEKLVKTTARQKLPLIKKKTPAPPTSSTIPAINVYDPFFGIKIRSPKVSFSDFSAMSASNDMKKQRLGDLRPGKEPEGPWVTMAVVVEKAPPKTSQKGNQYLGWKVSDMRGGDNQAARLMLFGDARDKLARLPRGTTIALFSPGFMDQQKKEVALRVSNSGQLLELGYCPDLGQCRGQRRSDGQPCGNWVNKALGDYCVFHLVAASKHMAAHRGELQSTTSIPPKTWERAMEGPDPQIRVSEPTHIHKRKPLTLEQIRCGKKRTVAKKEDGEEENPLVELMALPTTGAKNILKHLTSQEGNEKKPEKASRVGSGREFLKAVGGPKLGRGFGPTGQISLAKPKTSWQINADRAKAKAVNVIKKSGGLDKKRPNPKGAAKEVSPAKKRPKLGDIELKPEEVQGILEKKSSHGMALDEDDERRKEDYFQQMEKKEQVETRMSELMEVNNCKVLHCKLCKYTWHNQSSHCKRLGHTTEPKTATKRFFKCQNCKHRTIAYAMYPAKPCHKCRGSAFDRVPMRDSNNQPPPLKIRGEEEKFINK